MTATTKSSTKKHPKMKILIADDHWIVRETLKQVVLQVSREFQPIEASNFEEAQAILDANPTIALMLIDLIMPGFNEFEGLKKLRSNYPGIPIVVISVHEDLDFVLKSISHGVIGYIPKTSGAEEILRSLTRVLSGEVSFPRHIIEQNTSMPERQSKRPTSTSAVDISILTSRELNVLALIGSGNSVSDIAKQLGIKAQTVRVHIGNSMNKLGLNNRAELTHFAINNARLLVESLV